MANREVGLMQLADPEYLSLVKSPANQTGFKIIRDIQKEGVMAHTDRNLRVRAKTKRTDGLLSVDFPAGISQSDAEELMDSFGLGDDYSLETDDLGDYYAKRTGDQFDHVQATSIVLPNGFTANIASTSLESRSDTHVAGVTLVGLEFDETFDDVESVKRWMDERSVNFKTNGVESFEGGTAITRHDTPEGTEVRKVRLGDGVTGLVSKTKDTDVPDKVYRSVIEQSYGNWGWGHLNFATALADPAFTDASWDAIWVLQDVLENVIIYSGLPLDDRKSLVQNVCDQFTQYMTSLIDSLPREVIEQARADRNSKQEPDDMAIDKDSKKVTRKDTADTKTAEAKDDVAEDDTKEVTRDDDASKEDNSEYVLRSDMEDMVAKAVTAALKGTEKKEVTRSEEDENASDESTSEADNAGGTAVQEALSTMTEAMTVLGENMATITRSVKDMKGEIEEIGGSTVTRSDDADTSAEEEEDTSKASNAKRGDTVFDGMFGDRFSK